MTKESVPKDLDAILKRLKKAVDQLKAAVDKFDESLGEHQNVASAETGRRSTHHPALYSTLSRAADDFEVAWNEYKLANEDVTSGFGLVSDDEYEA